MRILPRQVRKPPADNRVLIFTTCSSAVQVGYAMSGNQRQRNALFRRRLDLVDWLLQHEDADLDDFCYDDGDAVLHVPGCWEYWRPREDAGARCSLDVVKQLLEVAREKGAGVNIEVNMRAALGPQLLCGAGWVGIHQLRLHGQQSSSVRPM